MFFPYKDDNPRVLVPYVTYGILSLNILVFIGQILLSISEKCNFKNENKSIHNFLDRIENDQFIIKRVISSFKVFLLLGLPNL